MRPAFYRFGGMQSARLALSGRTLGKKRKRVLQCSKDGVQIYPANGGKALPGHRAKKQAGQQRYQQEYALPSCVASNKRKPAIFMSGRKLCAWKTDTENLLNSMPSVSRALTILSMVVNFCEPIAGKLVNASQLIPLFQKELREHARNGG